MSFDEILASVEAQTLDLVGKNKDAIVEDFMGRDSLEQYGSAILWGTRLGAVAAIKTLRDANLLPFS